MSIGHNHGCMNYTKVAEKMRSRLTYRLVEFGLSLLYHPFAFMYDAVAWLVSAGQWRSWVLSSIPYLHGEILEIAYGPGHLQSALAQSGNMVYGLDESQNMTFITARRLHKHRIFPRLVRGMAQAIPFPSDHFDTVVSTFPAPFIQETGTIQELYRILKFQGRLVILIVGQMRSNAMLKRIPDTLLKITPQEIPGIEDFCSKFTAPGFSAHLEWVHLPHSKVLYLIAYK
ncbi:MAG: methyltransferase domain-containing protein [Anaerolineaceae bacterium]